MQPQLVPIADAIVAAEMPGAALVKAIDPLRWGLYREFLGDGRTPVAGWGSVYIKRDALAPLLVARGLVVDIESAGRRIDVSRAMGRSGPPGRFDRVRASRLGELGDLLAC